MSTLEVRGLLAVGVFGSYARGNWGVGSDLDLLIVLNSSALPFERRMALLPLESLPVPAEGWSTSWKSGVRCSGGALA